MQQHEVGQRFSTSWATWAHTCAAAPVRSHVAACAICALLLLLLRMRRAEDAPPEVDAGAVPPTSMSSDCGPNLHAWAVLHGACERLRGDAGMQCQDREISCQEPLRAPCRVQLFQQRARALQLLQCRQFLLRRHPVALLRRHRLSKVRVLCSAVAGRGQR